MDKNNKVLVNACALCMGRCWECSEQDYCSDWLDDNRGFIPTVWVEPSQVPEGYRVLS